MIRTEFKRQAVERRPLPAPCPVRRVAPTIFTDLVQSQPKEDAIYSEPYRRLVAMLPCANCEIEGLSQAAHPPPTGKGRKEDDRLCFPMCSTRPGVIGCHVLFDQYKLMPKSMMGEFAANSAKETRDTIEGNGQWPAKLPIYQINKETA